MYYTEYEGRKVYGFYYHSGESEGLPVVADIIQGVITISGELNNPAYYDATDADGISCYLLVVEGGLKSGTILERVVYCLQDLDDPEYNQNPDPDSVDFDWNTLHRRNIIQEDGTIKEIW
jgi:hypothetical protein